MHMMQVEGVTLVTGDAWHPSFLLVRTSTEHKLKAFEDLITFFQSEGTL